jgi:hypothetical protein
MKDKLDAAYGKLDELLEVHKEHPLTTNHNFLDNRKKLQQQDMKSQIQQKLKSISMPGNKLSVEDVTRLIENMDVEVDADMDMLAAAYAFDHMMAYYKVKTVVFIIESYRY